MNPRSQRAIDRLIKLEGGYVFDPHDPGGETKYGISKRSYPTTDILNLSYEQAAAIYFRDWWTRYRYDEIASDRIAFRLLDMAVVAGPRAAHKAIQKAINKVGGLALVVDGKLGNLSIEAINTLTGMGKEVELERAYQKKCREHFASLTKLRRFLVGWLNRVNAAVEE